MRLEFFLARKYLSSHRGRGLSVITWIALLGVIVGVMSLVATLAVMSGFEQELRSKILGNNAHIVVSAFSRSEDFFEEVTREVEATPGVASAMPVVYGEAFLLSPKGGSEGAFVKAVDPERVRSVLDINEYLFLKNWTGFEAGGVFMGASLARRLDLEPGEQVTLLLNRAEFSPFGVVPRMRRVEVVDVFHSGLTQYDSRHLYMPLELGKALFEKAPFQLEVRAQDLRQIGALRATLADKLRDRAQVHDWISENEGVLSALRLEKTVMGIILGLIILVAAFNICGSLIMVVRDKTKDIAILKSMGAPDSIILKIFLFQGVFIGFVGTLIGVLCGIVLSLVLRDWVEFPLNPEVYMIDQVPVDIRIADLLTVVGGALVISLMATLYPAKLASGLNPTEGLKVD